MVLCDTWYLTNPFTVSATTSTTYMQYHLIFFKPFLKITSLSIKFMTTR